MSGFSKRFCNPEELFKTCCEKYREKLKKKSNYEEVCGCCKTKNTFLTSSDFKLFINLLPKYKKKEVYKLIKYVILKCDCHIYINPTTKTFYKTNKKCIELFDIFNQIINKKEQLFMDKNFFAKTLKNIKLTEYKEMFHKYEIYSFYDMLNRIPTATKEFLKEKNRMKPGHAVKFFRTYETLRNELFYS